MERPEHIDQGFRRRLQDAEIAPPAVVWENVYEAVRRRRRIALWLFVGGLMLGGGSVGLWLIWSEHNLLSSAKGVEKAPALSKPTGIPAPSTTTHAPVPMVAFPLKNRQLSSPSPSSTPAPASETGIPGTSVAASASAEIGLHSAPVASSTHSENAAAPMLLPAPVLAALPLAPRQLDLSPAAMPIKKPNRNTQKCYKFSDKGRVWMLDAYGGPSWSLPRWRIRDSELDTYAADRRRTETPDGALHAGVRLSYFVHPNILLRTGLHYDQWVERFEYTDPNFIRYHITITQKLINGQWVSVTDTIGVEYGSEYIRTYNRFGLLDIPLYVGMEWRSGPMGLSFNAGGSVNALFFKRGTILNTDGKPVSFTPGSDGREVYRLRVGGSVSGSVQWFYHMAPRTRLFVEPYFRLVLRPITLPTYPIEQRQHLAGLRVGVSQILDKK